MISLEQSNEIVAYRAAWASYDTIVRKTGISLPTVIKTCKLRKDDIFKARKIAQEASVKSVSEYVEKRVQMYLEILQQACDELAGRDFSKMSTRELTSVIKTLERSITTIGSSNHQIDRASPTPFSQMSDEDLGLLARAEFGL